MKKILLICAAVATVASACVKEVDDNGVVNPNDGKNVVKITASVSAEEATRAVYADKEGISWETTDADKLGFLYDGLSDLESNHSTALTIADDGKGVFTVATDGSYEEILVYYPATVKFTEYEDFFTYFAAQFPVAGEQTQAEAGKFPLNNVLALSKTVKIEDDKTAETPMTLENAILRFLVYDSKGAYADETVSSVKVSAEEGYFTGYFDCSYMFGFMGVTAMAQGAEATVTVESGAAVGASTDDAEGIYLSILPVEAETALNGLVYTVTTDKAVYTFAAEQTYSFAKNTVYNTPLNLSGDKAVREELEVDVFVGSEDQSVEVEDVNAYDISYVDESGIFERAAAALGLDAVNENNTVMYVLCKGDVWKTAEEVNDDPVNSWFNADGYGCGWGESQFTYDIHYAGDHLEGCPSSRGLGGWSATLSFAIALPDGSKMYRVNLTVTILEPEEIEYDIVKTSEYELSIDYKDGYAATDITKYAFFDEALAALGVSSLGECTVYGVNTDGTFSNFSDDIWFNKEGNPANYGDNSAFDFHAWDQNVCNYPDETLIGWSQTITFGLVPDNNPDNKAALVKLTVTLNEPQAKDIQIVDTVQYTATVKYNDSYDYYEVEYDYASIATTLGVSNVWTECDIYYVNADLSFGTSPSTDNWFDADGNISSWGDNAVLDLKYEGSETFRIYIMPGETAASKCGTFTVRNAFVNEALQAVVFEATITVEE